MTTPSQPVRTTVRELVDHVVLDQLRSGRVDPAALPPGLRLLTWLATGLSVAAAVTIVAAPALRRTAVLGQGADGLTLPVVFIGPTLLGAMVALALFQTAMLHSPWWVRTLGMASSAAVFATLGTTTAVGPGAWRALAIMLGALGGLTLLLILRHRRGFVWWEFPVVLAFDVTVLLACASGLFGSVTVESEAAQLSSVSTAVISVALLAAPAAVAAGFAIAELALSTAVWAGRAVRERVPLRVLQVLLVLVVGWRVVAETAGVLRFEGSPVRTLLWSLGTLLVAGGLWWVIGRLAGTGVTGVGHLSERLRLATVPVGVVFGIGGLITLWLNGPALYAAGLAFSRDPTTQSAALQVALLPGVLLGRAVSLPVGRVVISLLLVGVAVLLARRGHRGLAEFVALIALLRIVNTIAGREDTLAFLPLLATAAVVGVAIAWARGGRLDPARTEALLVGVLCAALFGGRQVFADPAALLVGGIAALLIGLLWQLLTQNADAAGHSTRFPHATRLLMLQASSLIGFVALTFATLTRDPVHSMDLTAQQEIGDFALGGSLLLCALFALLSGAVRGDDVVT